MNRRIEFCVPRLIISAAFALMLNASTGLGVASADTPASRYPDLVRLNDGVYFRGTVVEFIPGEYAIIETPSGELRRVEASDAAYIGPAKDEPTREEEEDEPAFVEVDNIDPHQTDASSVPDDAEDELYHDGRLRVRIFSREEGLTLHETRLSGVVAGSNITGTIQAWAPLCTAPCEAWMAPGYYHRMLIENGRRKRGSVREPLVLDGPADLELAFQSNRVARIILLSLGIPLAVAGLGIMTAVPLSADSRCAYGSDCRVMNRDMLIGGAVAFGFGIGMVFAGVSVRDRGRISVHPYGALTQQSENPAPDAAH